MSGKTKEQIEAEKQRNIQILLNAVKKPNTSDIQRDKR